MTFEIQVNGKIFRNWENATIQRSLDENCGKFEFTSSNVIPADYPVRAGDSVQILINGQAKVTGFCDVVSSGNEDGVSTISVAGRDNTQDVIDSSMPDSVKNIEGPITLKSLCEKVISALGASIEVTTDLTNISEFSELELFNADAGKNCMEFLTDFSRKRQVYLISDGQGRLVIFRPSEAVLSGSLKNQREGRENNIISSSVTYNHAERFRVYSSRSQDNFGADPNADYETGIDRQGEAIDEQIRASRFLELQGEESFDETEIKNRAIEELNIRRARSTEYKSTIVGAERSTGILWDIGQLVKVNDDYAGLNGFFIVRALTFSINKNKGTTTTLTCAPPEAYNVRIPTQGDNRRAAQGANLQTETPPANSTRFVR